ncbi:unnamed protein product [Eruca vesicaria subsp. sativa]|uniref:Peptidase A1 domain-containing protein n=1 Tax=Eruca vesicaria subsp. sativa TaxID=29727 RepID=A0ABC8J687_ERUVS|nr:unnamed protein product [Eruca vesicaria subsp. sativa]
MDIFPVITMHFSGGADLVLGKNNTYRAFSGEGAICLTIVCGCPLALAPNQAIFGNKAQNNFLVGYDPSSRLVSFKPTSDCGNIPIDDHSVSAASLFQFNINFVLFLFALSLTN